MKKFEIGKVYRYYGNYDNTHDYKVIKRTAKYITIEDWKGVQVRKKIQVFSDDSESVILNDCYWTLNADSEAA